MLLVLYAAEWETKARKKDALAEAERARLALSIKEPRQLKERHQPEKSALRRLVTSLGHMGS